MKYLISNLTPEEQLGGGRGRHCRLALYHLGCLISLAWEPSQMPQAMHLLVDPTWENLLPLLHALAFINTISIIAIRIHYSQQKDKAGNTYLWIEFHSALSWDCFIWELFAVYILPSSGKKKRKPLNCKTVWVKEMPRDDLSRMLNRWSDLWDPRSSHSHSTVETANFIFFKHKSYLVSPCWRLFIIAIRQL